MKCPYQFNFDCPFVETLDMTKSVRCPECKFYKDDTTMELEKRGISKEEIDDLNEFMMGL